MSNISFSGREDEFDPVLKKKKPNMKNVKHSFTENPNDFKCPRCDQTFNILSNMYRHMRRMHSVEPMASPVLRNLKCPVCSESLKSYSCLDEHLLSTHQISVNETIFQFDDFEAFRDWKTREENATISFYAFQCSYSLKEGNVQKYQCHRSGYFVSKRKGEKIREVKRMGSNKINSTCPARITVTEGRSGTVKVQYICTHVGHEQEVARVRLASSKKETNFGKLTLKKIDSLGRFTAQRRENNIEVEKNLIVDKLNAYISEIRNCQTLEEVQFVKQAVDGLSPGLKALQDAKTRDVMPGSKCYLKESVEQCDRIIPSLRTLKRKCSSITNN